MTVKQTSQLSRLRYPLCQLCDTGQNAFSRLGNIYFALFKIYKTVTLIGISSIDCQIHVRSDHDGYKSKQCEHDIIFCIIIICNNTFYVCYRNNTQCDMPYIYLHYTGSFVHETSVRTECFVEFQIDSNN